MREPLQILYTQGDLRNREMSSSVPRLRSVVSHICNNLNKSNCNRVVYTVLKQCQSIFGLNLNESELKWYVAYKLRAFRFINSFQPPIGVGYGR